ncbi:hypothetical protein Tco_0287988 [Tanacetum coccineum]
MEEIKTTSAEGYQYLVNKDPCTWLRAYFKEGIDCDAVENGLSELFNSHIKIARRKPIIGKLEDIRSYVMTRNYMLRKECDWKSEICPNIRKVLELHKKIQRLDLQALLGLDHVLNKVVDMISCTSESKPLVLP